MILKAGVRIQGVQPPILYALGVSEGVYRFHGAQMVVTSLTDSHDDKPGSLHPKGYAADTRTRGIPLDMVRAIAGSLKAVLDPMGYDIVLESDHIHAEYDPKLGETWLRFLTTSSTDDFVA